LSKKERIKTTLPPIVFIVLMFIIWEIVVWALKIKPLFLPPPSMVFKKWISFAFILLPHLQITLYETLAGLAAGIILGMGLAILITYSNVLRNTLMPILLLLESVPKMAFAPLVLVWFGYGDLPKILVALLVAFFPIVVDTATGLNAVEPELMDLIRSFKASTLQIYTKVRIPNSLPYFFSALKVASALSVVGALVAEFVGSKAGIGYILLAAELHIDTSLIIVCIFILALIGIGLYAIVSFTERLIMPWKAYKEKRIKEV
jgi:NitT/TauT family transport system permease protein